MNYHKTGRHRKLTPDAFNRVKRNRLREYTPADSNEYVDICVDNVVSYAWPRFYSVMNRDYDLDFDVADIFNYQMRSERVGAIPPLTVLDNNYLKGLACLRYHTCKSRGNIHDIDSDFIYGPFVTISKPKFEDKEALRIYKELLDILFDGYDSAAITFTENVTLSGVASITDNSISATATGTEVKAVFTYDQICASMDKVGDKLAEDPYLISYVNEAYGISEEDYKNIFLKKY